MVTSSEDEAKTLSSAVVGRGVVPSPGKPQKTLSCGNAPVEGNIFLTRTAVNIRYQRHCLW